MIDLTVKTLDSQNHVFSLADDITIREFKEHIAATVNVAADSQRLIYCGRVLQDEKHLSDYDVNGKVIHLVHRAPPQSVQHGNSQSQGQGQNDQGQNRGHGFRQARAQFHGNPMYLGSISIPAEVVEGPESPLPQLSITLATSRTMTAQRMLQEANLVLDRLESTGTFPRTRSANEGSAAASRGAAANRGDGTATADSSSSDASVSENDESASGNDANAELPQSALDILDMFIPDHSTSAVSNAAYQIAVGFVQAVRSSNNSETREGNNGTSGSEPSAPAAETTDENQSATQEQEQSPRQERSNAATSENNRPSEQNSGTAALGTLLGTLMDTEARLRNHLVLYRELMMMDPVLPSINIGRGEDRDNLVELNQRLIDGVSECLHYMAHANHALSDVIVDLGQQPPRNLRCRPVLIHQSAILQGAIPIQVEAHISVARNDGSHGESANGEENSESANRPPNWTAGAAPTAQPATDTASDQSETTSSTPTQQSEQQQQQQQQQQQPHNHPQVNSTIGAIFNLTNNMELLMEMAPSENGGGITVSGVGGTATQLGQNNGSNNNNNININNNAPGASGVPGMIPWGPAPPPGLIQNLMNAVAGYMVQGAGNAAAAAAAANAATPATTTTTSTTTTPTNPRLGYLRRRVMTSAERRAPRTPGQSTQARSNVDTHPTTSTQTRSTSRLHVIRPNAHPLGVGMGHNMDFDILLPCNSHHIRRAQPSAATSNNSTATASPQQTSQPSQSTTPNGVVPQQPEGSTTAGNASNATPAGTETNVRLKVAIAKQRRSDGTKSENPVTLEELLLSRGIREPDRLLVGSVLWQLYTACAKIDLSEWYALIDTGKFNREDTWHRLRTEITNLMSVTGKLCASTFVSSLSMEIELYLRSVWGLDESARIVDDQWMVYGVNMTNLIRQLLGEPATFIEKNVSLPDEEWGANLSAIVQRRAREMCTIFRTSLYEFVRANRAACYRGEPREQAAVENFIRTFAARASSNIHPELREWIVDSVAQWFCEYSRPREGELDAEDAQRIDETPEMPIFEDVAGILGTQMIPPPQPEPEPMETEEASGTRVINDPLDVDDGEPVPSIFAGYGHFLPEWVPIIARDGVRQRRQLQLQSEGITGFSDAYLEGMPSKRRKLVERLKPRLLVNPPPNQSVISASVERLVRESVFGASVEEADGSAAAVAADPGVRRAFGQAIRECLESRRLESPNFPDARRFPNATRYFSDKDKPAKQ